MLVIGAIIIGIIVLGKKATVAMKSSTAQPLAAASMRGAYQPTATTQGGEDLLAPQYGWQFDALDSSPNGVQFTQEQIGKASVQKLTTAIPFNKPGGTFGGTGQLPGFAGVVQGSNLYSKIKVQ